MGEWEREQKKLCMKGWLQNVQARNPAEGELVLNPHWGHCIERDLLVGVDLQQMF